MIKITQKRLYIYITLKEFMSIYVADYFKEHNDSFQLIFIVATSTLFQHSCNMKPEANKNLKITNYFSKSFLRKWFLIGSFEIEA